MRPVDVGLALSQYDLVLIGTVGRFGTHCQLEACGDTACWAHNPVPAIALIELRTFAGTVFRAVAVKDDNGLSDGSCTVCR